MVFGSIQETNDYEHEEEQRIIEGPNSQAAPDIEILEIARRLLRIQKNPGNQHPGQHEEKVHSHPTIAEQFVRMKKGVFRTDVVKHHDQNRQAADGVELRDSSWHFLNRLK